MACRELERWADEPTSRRGSDRGPASSCLAVAAPAAYRVEHRVRRYPASLPVAAFVEEVCDLMRALRMLRGEVRRSRREGDAW